MSSSWVSPCWIPVHQRDVARLGVAHVSVGVRLLGEFQTDSQVHTRCAFLQQAAPFTMLDAASLDSSNSPALGGHSRAGPRSLAAEGRSSNRRLRSSAVPTDLTSRKGGIHAE